MKSTRIIALLIFLVCIVLLSLPIFFKTIPFDHQVDIQSPVEKAYNSISSSYEDIFMSSEIEMINKWDREIIDTVRNEKLITAASNGELNINTEIQFINRNKITRLEIHEDLSFDSWIDHAFGVILNSSIKQKRINHYTRVKQGIESTPDLDFKPDELKWDN